MKSIKEILMKNDNMSPEAAEELIDLAKEALADYLEEGDTMAAGDICLEFFGLEPDYLDQLI